MRTAERLRAIFCWLRRRHHRVALLTGPEEVIIVCPVCLGGGEVPILRPATAPKPPTRSAADLLHDIHSGRQSSETIAVDTVELLSLAATLLDLAVPEGDDPHRLLDVLVTAALDPDRQKST